MDLFTKTELEALTKKLNIELTTECEGQFLLWRNKMKQVLVGMDLPDGLEARLDNFILENKPSFFRGYREKLKERITLQKLRQPIPIAPTPIKVEKFNIQKDRTFLEAYYLNGKCYSKAAKALGVAKSTYHDWAKRNTHLFESEALQASKNKVSSAHLSAGMV